MAQVSVTINNRKYDVSCDDGQEAHLARLASYVDKHIGDLVGQVGQIGDARLLVMASLLVADELSDAMAEMDDLKARLATVEQGGGKGNGADPAELAATMDDLSSRIEAIAARLEQA
ncbi:MAG: cell division protein ZapA [Rhodobacterales bacterium]|nr:cell division protein ZapA [Rhodobacterales bacterium]